MQPVCGGREKKTQENRTLSLEPFSQSVTFVKGYCSSAAACLCGFPAAKALEFKWHPPLGTTLRRLAPPERKRLSDKETRDEEE